MKKFIYVFNEETAKSLIAQGGKLIKTDKANNVYVFINEPSCNFTFSKKDFVYSDMLTF